MLAQPDRCPICFSPGTVSYFPTGRNFGTWDIACPADFSHQLVAGFSRAEVVDAWNKRGAVARQRIALESFNNAWLAFVAYFEPKEQQPHG